MNNKHAAVLETLIDQYGVSGVMRLLCVICNEKSDHIAANWQDNVTARRWERASETLYNQQRRIATILDESPLA